MTQQAATFVKDYQRILIAAAIVLFLAIQWRVMSSADDRYARKDVVMPRIERLELWFEQNSDEHKVIIRELGEMHGELKRMNGE